MKQAPAPRLRSALQASAAWVVLPAIAMAVSLGVSLPTQAQTALPGSSVTINLADPGYAGATSFSVGSFVTIDSSTGYGISGNSAERWTLTNAGTLTAAASSAVYFGLLGGTLGNTGTIAGDRGITSLGALILDNQDLIQGNGYGVYADSGSITNGSSSNHAASITGGTTGIFFSASSGVLDSTLTNYGTITGGGAGIYFGDSGSVRNFSGLISGYSAGISFNGTTSGTVVNYAGATISGANFGIYGGPNSSLTITNAGTLIGTGGTALQFGGGDDQLLIGDGAVFMGSVDGGGGNNMLGFVANSGTLGGLADFQNFQTVTFTNGQDWALDGDFSFGIDIINSGTLRNDATLHLGNTLTNDGAFTNNGAIDNYSAIINTGNFTNSGDIYSCACIGTFTSSGYLLNTSSGGIRGGITLTGTVAVVTNAGTIAGDIAAITGDLLSNPTIINTGAIGSAPFSLGYGIILAGDGSISNSAAGLGIYGYYGAIQIAGTGTIVNDGNITGRYGPAIALSNGTITNGGITPLSAELVSYFGNAVELGGGAAITNFGTIITNGGANTSGIQISGDGTVTNSGLISGYRGIYVTGPSGNATILNHGTITGSIGVSGAYGQTVALTNLGAIVGTVGGGVMLLNGGAVSNSGTIRSINGAGIVFTGGYDGTVINSGAIIGGGGNAITFGYGNDLLRLEAGASLTGAADGGGGYDTLEIKTGVNISGVFSNFEIGTIANLATLTTAGASSIYALANDGNLINTGTLSSYYLGNYGSFTNSGSFTGVLGNGGVVLNYGQMSSVVLMYDNSRLTNDGTIDGLVLSAGAGVSITNTGTIAAPAYSGVAILLAGGGEVTNSGVILSNSTTGVGIALLYGESSIFNTGLISGGQLGVAGYADVLAITNQGTIQGGTGGGGAGILLQSDGIEIVNSGLITGANYGVASSGHGGTISNSGTISGGIGVYLYGGGQTLRNAGTGTISGEIGVAGGGFADTLINSGTIIGTNGTSVNMGGDDDLLIIAPGAVFTGLVEGGVGFNTLQFAGGTQIPDFANFVNFGRTVLEPGTRWTFASTFSLPSGMALVNGGTIVNASTLIHSGLITNNGIFTNSGTINGGGGFSNGGSLTNSGLITGSAYGVTGGGAITNSGTIIGADTGVSLTGGTLTNTGLIDGGTYGLRAGAGAVIFNSGIIKDDAIAGATLGSNAVFTNNAGATLSGVTGAVFTGMGASLTNAGTITGTGGIAIQLGTGINTVTLGNSSVLNGTINSGGGASRIVLTGAGGQSPVLSGFGAGSSLTVASGASRSASNWTIGSVVNNGTLSLGATPATVTFTGNFVQSSTGTLNAVLGDDGTSSAVRVTGTATLDGALQVVMPSTVGAPVRYTIISAAGGLGGAFANDLSGTVLLSSVLSYDANNAYVTVAQRRLTAPIGVNETPNQFAVAGAFDIGVLADPAGFGTTLAAFNRLQAPGFVSALNQISGEQIVDVSTTALLAGRQFLLQIQQHNRLSPQAQGTWAFWGQAFGQSGNLDGDGNSHRLNQGLAGGVIGADFSLTPFLRLGGVLGYGGGHFNVAGGLGGGRMDYKQVAVTATYNDEAFYLDGAFGGIFGSGSTHRDIAVGTLTSRATGQVSTSQIIGAAEVGYTVALSEDISLVPFARLQTGSVSRDAFAESGAGILDLAAPDQGSFALQSILGARFGTTLTLVEMPFALDGSLGWSHELLGTARLARLSFAGTPGTDFTIAGAGLSGDSAQIGLGLSTRIFGQGEIRLHYDGSYGGNGASHGAGLGLRFAW